MTTTVFLIAAAHTAALCGFAYYFGREYRRTVRANNRRVEQLVAAYQLDGLRDEITYLRSRNEILMRGLFPRGDVFPGSFMEDDPELRALAELIDTLKTSGAVAPSPATRPSLPTDAAG